MNQEYELFKDKVTDSASLDMMIKAKTDCIDTCFDRMETQKNQCAFGKSGVCCRICHMGPCRITNKAPKGVCGSYACIQDIIGRWMGRFTSSFDSVRYIIRFSSTYKKQCQFGSAPGKYSKYYCTWS